MKVAIIGCGNMGYAYARSFINNHLVKNEDLLIIEQNEERADWLKNRGIGNVVPTATGALGDCDAVIIAVKPQGFQEAAQVLKPLLKEGQIIISIMAGVKIDSIVKALGQELVVRAMPNTPSQLGQGITGYTVTDGISMDRLSKIDSLLKSNGKTVLVEKEEQLDAVTALSGSGPAYWFYLTRAMVKAGVELGLDERTASLLVEETLHGSYYLMVKDAKSYDDLIEAVRSKGGTTDAALKSFDANQVDEKIVEALKACHDRAGELSKLIG